MKTDPYEWELQHRTPNGGFKKEDLASIGIQWPPPKGWLASLKREWDLDQPGKSPLKLGKSWLKPLHPVVKTVSWRSKSSS